MMETCLDEGTLQAYIDGELSPETSNGVAAHLSACANCAEAAHAAEQELALFSTAFTHALPASVPTAKLRARIDDAIAEMNATERGFAIAPASRLRSVFDSLVKSLTTFAPRQATAFASFLVVIVLAVVFFALMRTPDGQQTTGGEIARNDRTSAPAPSVVQTENSEARRNDSSAVPAPDEEFNVPAPAPVRRVGSSSVVKAGLNVRPQVERTRLEGGNAETGNATVAAAATVAEAKSEPLLEDEKTYISSIASLTSAIEAQRAEGMTPTLRAEYERNLAVVNQAIVSSRVAARRNPQDTDAKEFLRAAYQNKVELLSAVADQAQIASSRD
jgi:anti-sigma factor RsiW